MINNQTDNNIKLTSEEIGRLEAVKMILRNLESEISIAQKHIRALKSDTDNLVKEKMYQEELLSNVNQQVSDTKNQLEYLKSEQTNLNSALVALNSEINSKSDAQNAKIMELKDREDSVDKKEMEVGSKEVSLLREKENFRTEKEEFEGKVAKLKAVTGVI